MNEIKKKYPWKRLFRVHRGFLINLDKIHRIKGEAGGMHVITFNNEKFPSVPVARRRFNDLKRALGLGKK